MSGLTDTGFSRPILDDIAALLLADERGLISGQLDGSPSSILGNINTVFADQLAQAWEVLEEAYNALDPDNATDDRVVAIALLRGVIRRAATKGLVSATVNLNASQSFAPGDLIAHVNNEPSNRWVNRDTVTSTTSGNYTVVFQAETAGSGHSAAAGTLTVIASPVDGWNSITNAADATDGSDQETIEDLRQRSEASLARAGASTVDAIQADLEQVSGVLEVLVQDNTTDTTDVNGLPAHSVRATIWDGAVPAADNNAVAQVLFDNVAAGILSFGSQSGNATASNGATVAVAFERAAQVTIYVTVTIVSAVGVAAADVKAAIIAAMPTLIGGDVVYNRLSGSVFSVAGVDNYSSFHIGTAPSPSGTTDIAISSGQIAQLTTSNITLSGDVS